MAALVFEIDSNSWCLRLIPTDSTNSHLILVIPSVA